MFSKQDENSSAEYYYNQADEHKKIIKTQWHTFLKTGIIVFAALIGIIALCLAWFAYNARVSATGSGVSAQQQCSFELATLKDASKQGIFDDNEEEDSSLINALKQNYLGKYTSFSGLPSLSEGESTYNYGGKTYILGNSDGISLMVNDSENLDNAKEDQQLGPGSKGEFTVYIIPKVVDLDSVTISIALEGYTLEGSSTVAKEANAVKLSDSSLSDTAKDHLLNCICGHLLLFEGKDAGTENYSGQVVPTMSGDRAVYTITVSPEDGFQKDVPYPVRLYWMWPKHFDGMVFPGGSESVFETACDGQSALITRINNNKNLIFFATEGLENIDTASMTNAQLMEWSKAYNRGDQLIGNRVAFFNWVIDANN